MALSAAVLLERFDAQFNNSHDRFKQTTMITGELMGSERRVTAMALAAFRSRVLYILIVFCDGNTVLSIARYDTCGGAMWNEQKVRDRVNDVITESAVSHGVITSIIQLQR